MRASDHYTVISADCHAGGSHAQYREYLDGHWRAEFDAWRAKYSNPFRDLQGDGRTRNWDGTRRIADQEAEGVVAEVIFPNTVPPFFPTGSVIAPAPSPDEYEARLVGIRAHNRWLADFCAEAPERRAGQTQIFLNDVDDAVQDIIWGQEHGLRGVLLPGVSPDTPWIEPLFSPKYDPIWQVCQERDIPVTHHAGGTGVPKLPKVPCSVVMFVMEAGFWANRVLWHLTMSGVFERFPGLTLVLTEQGTSWVPEVLDRMDQLSAEMQRNGRIGELGIDPSVVLPKSRATTSGATCSSEPRSPRPVMPPQCGSSASIASCGGVTIRTWKRRRRIRRNRCAARSRVGHPTNSNWYSRAARPRSTSSTSPRSRHTRRRTAQPSRSSRPRSSISPTTRAPHSAARRDAGSQRRRRLLRLAGPDTQAGRRQ